MTLGTHNSCTYAKAIWWLRPLQWLMNPFSKCQSRTIDEQLEDGVRFFNLQITFYKNDWYFSHGSLIYNLKFWDVLDKLLRKARRNRPIYIQVYYDDNFFIKKNLERWEHLKKMIEAECEGYYVKVQRFWNENGETYPEALIDINYVEKYWGWYWIKKSKIHKWYEKLPIPYLHARKYNKIYKQDTEHNFVMLDFYHLG